MTAATLHIDPHVLRTIRAAALAAWPGEFVGLLGGERDPARCGLRIAAFVPLAAATTTADAFAVPPPAFARAEAELRARGAPWLGFVHSHPDGVAAPSQRDQRELWRHCVQMIVATTRAGEPRIAAYWFDDRGAHPFALETGVGVEAP